MNKNKIYTVRPEPTLLSGKQVSYFILRVQGYIKDGNELLMTHSHLVVKVMYERKYIMETRALFHPYRLSFLLRPVLWPDLHDYADPWVEVTCRHRKAGLVMAVCGRLGNICNPLRPLLLDALGCH